MHFRFSIPYHLRLRNRSKVDPSSAHRTCMFVKRHLLHAIQSSHMCSVTAHTHRIHVCGQGVTAEVCTCFGAGSSSSSSSSSSQHMDSARTELWVLASSAHQLRIWRVATTCSAMLAQVLSSPPRRSVVSTILSRTLRGSSCTSFQLIVPNTCTELYF
mgnify:CR=1 FL=1